MRNLNSNDITAAVEAILFAYSEPISPQKLAEIINVPVKHIKNSLKNLEESMSDNNRGIKLICLDGKYQFCTKEKFSDYIKNALSVKKNTKLSQSLLEILAIIAYNQPVTKSFVEQIRGVDCSYGISTLLSKELIDEAGRLNLPGKPITYKTTDNFLRCLGISNLDQLPDVTKALDSEYILSQEQVKLTLKM